MSGINFIMEENMVSYSTDMLKRAAFQDELTNILDITPPEYRDEGWAIVQTYFQKRIKEIERSYK
jgi:hypothetical protein